MHLKATGNPVVESFSRASGKREVYRLHRAKLKGDLIYLLEAEEGGSREGAKDAKEETGV